MTSIRSGLPDTAHPFYNAFKGDNAHADFPSGNEARAALAIREFESTRWGTQIRNPIGARTVPDELGPLGMRLLGWRRKAKVIMLKSIKTLTVLAAFGCGALFAGGVGPAQAYTGEELARNASITLEQARAIALKARPGTITDQELEKERGGSGLRYSFDVKSGGKNYEVGVDAKTGKVLEVSVEGANAD